MTMSAVVSDAREQHSLPRHSCSPPRQLVGKAKQLRGARIVHLAPPGEASVATRNSEQYLSNLT